MRQAAYIGFKLVVKRDNKLLLNFFIIYYIIIYMRVTHILFLK